MASPLNPRQDLTGLVLAGGQGRRMGQEKGLTLWQGRPLAQHALERLRPQVCAVALNVNRHLEDYAEWGAPMWGDPQPGALQGPLAGMLTGLQNMTTEWLLTVPCDAPQFPLDLAQKLCQALSANPPHTRRRTLAALACTAALEPTQNAAQNHPVFALIHRDLAPSLAQFLAQGERQVGLWLSQQQALPVWFDDPQAFANLNTPAELQAGLALAAKPCLPKPPGL